MTPRKWLKAIVLIFIPFVVLLSLGLFTLKAYLLVHPLRWSFEVTSQGTGRPVEKVTFRASDGLELVGWFIRGEKGGATIVASHGSGSCGWTAYQGYSFLNQAGYNLMVLDHRGHGQSGGKFTTLGFHEVRDLVGTVAYLRSRPDVDPNRIGAIGCSMGSAVVIGAAAAEPAISAVVAESVYADAGQLWMRFGYIGIPKISLSFSYGLPLKVATRFWTGEWMDRFKPVELIGQISPRPVLIIHGEYDNAACTVADAKRLYQAAGEPKELWIVPGAGHCGMQAAHPEEYRERVRRFFDAALR